MLNRFLRRLGQSGKLRFPLTVKKCHEPHGPDFVLRMGEEQHGIQITDAVDPEEQRDWTGIARITRDAGDEAGWKVSDIPNERMSGNRYVDMVRLAIDNKLEKTADSVTDLLINLDTSDTAFDNAEKRLTKLAHLSDYAKKFRNVWIFTSGDLIDLTNRYVVQGE